MNRTGCWYLRFKVVCSNTGGLDTDSHSYKVKLRLKAKTQEEALQEAYDRFHCVTSKDLSRHLKVDLESLYDNVTLVKPFVLFEADKGTDEIALI